MVNVILDSLVLLKTITAQNSVTVTTEANFMAYHIWKPTSLPSALARGKVWGSNLSSVTLLVRGATREGGGGGGGGGGG